MGLRLFGYLSYIVTIFRISVFGNKYCLFFFFFFFFKIKGLPCVEENEDTNSEHKMMWSGNSLKKTEDTGLSCVNEELVTLIDMALFFSFT